MYFIEKPVRIDLHHLSFARRSYRRAILPEDDRTRKSLMKPTLFVMKLVCSQADLPQIIHTLRARRALSNALDRRQKKSDQHTHDPHDDQSSMMGAY